MIKCTLLVALLLTAAHGDPAAGENKDGRDFVRTVGGRKISAKELDEAILTVMRSTKMPGVSIAVINNAEVVYHRAFGVKNINAADKINKQTLFEAASLSKPLFAYFVMKQVEKGILELDKPLYEYMPYADVEHDERYKLITARMVLSHTSGFPNWRKDKLEIMFTPGTRQQYSGEGYQYLAKVLAHLRGVDDTGLDSIFQKEVAQPMGAEHLHYIWNEYIAQHKATGHNKGKPTQNGPQVGQIIFGTTYNGPQPGPNVFGAAYSLHTEANDYAKFLIHMLKEDGLSKELFKEMLRPQVLPADDDTGKSTTTDRCLGFAIDHTPRGIFYYHTGNNGDFRAYCCFYKKTGFGMVFFTNCDEIKPLRKKLGEILLEEN